MEPTNQGADQLGTKHAIIEPKMAILRRLPYSVDPLFENR